MAHGVFALARVGHGDGGRVDNSPRHFLRRYSKTKLPAPVHAVHGVGDGAVQRSQADQISCVKGIGALGGDLHAVHLPAVGGGAPGLLHPLGLSRVQRHLYHGLVGRGDVDNALGVAGILGVQRRGIVQLRSQGLHDHAVAARLEYALLVAQFNGVGLGAHLRGVYAIYSFRHFHTVELGHKAVIGHVQADPGLHILHRLHPIGALVHLHQGAVCLIAALSVCPECLSAVYVAVGLHMELAGFLLAVLRPGQGHGLRPLALSAKPVGHSIRLDTLHGLAVLGHSGLGGSVYRVALIRYARAYGPGGSLCGKGNVIQGKAVGIALRGLHPQIPVHLSTHQLCAGHIDNIFPVLLHELKGLFCRVSHMAGALRAPQAIEREPRGRIVLSPAPGRVRRQHTHGQ